MQKSKTHIAIRRILAFGIDWLLIAAWGALLFGIVMLSSSGDPGRPAGPWQSQAIGFFSMTLPIVLYFSISEYCCWQASVGKRMLGLRIRDMQSGSPSFGRILLRNVVKFVPWELGHLVANQMIFSTAPPSGWIYIPMLLSTALPLWWILSIFIGGTAPYDRISGVRVNLIQMLLD